MNVKFGCSSFKTAVRLSNQICSKRSGDHILLPTFAIFLQTRYKTTSEWKRLYDEKKKAAYDLNASTANSMNPNGVFANNETDLNTIEVYGFDYDYTLACYKPELHELIYDLGITELVHKYQYPEGILKELKYTKDFAVRGLHYDIARGFLLKLDSFHNIQLGTVYRGLSPLEDVEVKSHYFGTHVPFQDMSTFYGTGPMYQLVDLFAVPEILLLASITEYFINNNIPYDPEYVFYDIRTAVQGIHSTSLLHTTIMQNLEKYLEKADSLKEFLTRLKKSDRKIFLITNSSFPFVDAGMKYMMGDDWEHLFDVIICKARKPKFFNESTRPFRRYDKGNNMETWDRVSSLVKGRVYQEGNINFFKQMTDFHGARVLYFGDHVYSDLADPALKLGWKTGAIIPELETEIEKGNSADFQAAVRWLCDLQLLIENAHVEKNPETIELVQEWLKEREKIREYTKGVFNPRFGSMFRTHHNPTYFTRRLARFADIYTSRLINLLEYPVDHTFYPRRMALPHEPNLTSSLWV